MKAKVILQCVYVYTSRVRRDLAILDVNEVFIAFTNVVNYPFIEWDETK